MVKGANVKDVELEEKIKQVTRDLRSGFIKSVENAPTIIKYGKSGACSA